MIDATVARTGVTDTAKSVPGRGFYADGPNPGIYRLGGPHR